MHTHEIDKEIGISGKELRILVVEDRPSIARLLLTTLSTAGFDCRFAPDAGAAVTALREVDLHLVLLVLPCAQSHRVYAGARAHGEVPISAIHPATLKVGEEQRPFFQVETAGRTTQPLDPNQLAIHVLRQLRQLFGNTIVADVNLAPTWIPAGWAVCEVCRYRGPVQNFEAHDTAGLRVLACPECRRRGNLTFAVWWARV